MVPDSGGAGQWRGGLALRREYELLEDATVIRRFNKIKFPPAGLAGGEAGTRARFVVRLGTDQEFETPASARFEMKAGERFLVQSAGGGGYGDPAKRDAAARLPAMSPKAMLTAGKTNKRQQESGRRSAMSFSSWRGVVGMVNPTMRPGMTEEVCRLLPEGIGLIPLFLNISRGTEDEFETMMPHYEKLDRGAGRAELRHHPSERRAAVHGARLQGRGEDRRGLGEEVQDPDHAASRRTTCARSRRSRPRASSARPISPTSSTRSSRNISRTPASRCAAWPASTCPSTRCRSCRASRSTPTSRSSFLKAKGADAIYMLGSGWRTLNIIDAAGAGPAGAGGASGHRAGLGVPEVAKCPGAAQRLRRMLRDSAVDAESRTRTPSGSDSDEAKPFPPIDRDR